MLHSNRGMCFNWNALVATAETTFKLLFKDEDSIICWLTVLSSTDRGIGTHAGAVQSWKQACSQKLIKYARNNDLYTVHVQ